MSALRMSAAGAEATRDISLPDAAWVMRAFRYGVSPAIPPQRSDAVDDGAVGSRLPHFWLDAERTRSSIDLCGRRLLLVSRDSRWREAAARSGALLEFAWRAIRIKAESSSSEAPPSRWSWLGGRSTMDSYP